MGTGKEYGLVGESACCKPDILSYISVICRAEGEG